MFLFTRLKINSLLLSNETQHNCAYLVGYIKLESSGTLHTDIGKQVQSCTADTVSVISMVQAPASVSGVFTIACGYILLIFMPF